LLDDHIGAIAEKIVGADFNWQFAALVSIGVLMVLSVFSMYIRPDFPNVMLISAANRGVCVSVLHDEEAVFPPLQVLVLLGAGAGLI
jgi:hypothetical protein